VVSEKVEKVPAKLDLLSRLDASFGSSPAPFDSASVPGYSMGDIHSVVKPEPTDSVVPRKRLSDVATTTLDIKREPNVLHPPLNRFPADRTQPKKAKLEAAKTPLAQVNRNSSHYNQMVAPGLSVEQARERLRDTQNSISFEELVLDRLCRKSNPSNSDRLRMRRIARRISELRVKKEEYIAAIPSAAALKHTGSENKSLVSLPTPVKYQPVASGSKVQRPAYNGPTLDQKPILGQPPINPAPSGSNVRSSSTRPVEPVDIMRRLEAAIPSVAGLPGPSDGLDENGDFHGRGRDPFVGPQAKADEYVHSCHVELVNNNFFIFTVSTNFCRRQATLNSLTGTRLLRKLWRNWGFRRNTNFFPAWRWH
jgi:hypothetical protein